LANFAFSHALLFFYNFSPFLEQPVETSRMSNGEESITEDKVQIEDCGIGYQRYGHGPEYFIFICGGVGE
jgi:hypothetical protein